MDALELAWAAGFFDGEGTITLSGTNAPRTDGNGLWRWQFYVGCNQATTAIDDMAQPAVITRFAAAVGVGRIHGPYRYTPGRRPLFKWMATSQAAVEALRRLWPFLGPVKRSQAVATYERWTVRPGLHRLVLVDLPWEEAAA